MLGGLIVWAAHFFVIYGIGSIFPGTSTARLLALLATAPALAADAALIWFGAARKIAAGQDGLKSSMVDIGLLAAVLSFVAVLWQALPAIIQSD